MEIKKGNNKRVRERDRKIACEIGLADLLVNWLVDLLAG